MNIDSLFYYEKVSRIALGFPGMIASTSYGTPAFKFKKKLVARFWEDGETLVVYTQQRAKWLKRKPGTFFITDHYKDHPWVLVRLSKLRDAELEQLFSEAWKYRSENK